MNPIPLMKCYCNQKIQISSQTLSKRLKHMNIEVVGHLRKIVMSTIITKINMEISRLVYPFSISSVRDYQMED